jgi:mercuric ion binding protein
MHSRCKIMFKGILIAAFLLVAQSLSAQDKKATLVVKTPNTCNHCKVCETCGGKLETDLYFVRGIKVVEYNEEAQTTTIVYKPKQITPEKIREEIAKLGFDADAVKADPAGYEKRDNCCK